MIISYDGTPNDDDALALGRLLGRAGASLSLAYVRHSREYDPDREALAQHDAIRRLDLGAAWLDDPDIPRHVVFSASTGKGLAALADAEGASLVVFGSDYRTPPGRVEPGRSAQQMLEGGGVAIAVAPAGLRSHPEDSIGWVAIYADGEDDAALRTAEALASEFGAELLNGADPTRADLIVVGSAAGTPPGQVRLSGAIRQRLDAARASVLVVPNSAPVEL